MVAAADGQTEQPGQGEPAVGRARVGQDAAEGTVGPAHGDTASGSATGRR